MAKLDLPTDKVTDWVTGPGAIVVTIAVAVIIIYAIVSFIINLLP